MNLIKNIFFKNSLWSTLDILTFPLFFVISTPVFINSLGLEEYGVWMFVNSLAALLGVVNAGVGDSIVKSISHYRGNTEKQRQVFETGLLLNFIILGLMIGAGLILSHYDFLWNFLAQDGKDYNPEIISAALVPAVFIFSLKLNEVSLLSFFKGHERFDLYGKTAILSKVIVYGTQLALALSGHNLIEILWGSAFAYILVQAVELFYVVKKFNFLRLRLSLHRSVFREIFNFSFYAWIQSIIGVIFGQIDKLIVVYLAGLEVFTYYSIGAMVANQLQSVFTASANWSFPFYSRHKESRTINRLYYSLQSLSVSIFLPVVIVLTLLSSVIFPLWLGEDVYAEARQFIFLFLIYLSLLLTSIQPFFFLNGVGKIKVTTFFMAMTTSVSIVMMLLGYHYFEAPGLVYGRIFSLYLVCPLQYLYLGRNILRSSNFLFGLLGFIPSLIFSLTLFRPDLAPFIVLITLCSGTFGFRSYLSHLKEVVKL